MRVRLGFRPRQRIRAKLRYDGLRFLRDAHSKEAAQPSTIDLNTHENLDKSPGADHFACVDGNYCSSTVSVLHEVVTALGSKH